jgi:predicted nucleic acid-binding protein
VVDDPVALSPIGSRDPNGDYLIALAARTRSILVTGDADLLALAGRIPVMTPRAFFDRLEREA